MKLKGIIMLIVITMFFRYSYAIEYNIPLSNNTHYTINAQTNESVYVNLICSGYYENISFEFVTQVGFDNPIYMNMNYCKIKGNMSNFAYTTSSTHNFYLSHGSISNYRYVYQGGWAYLEDVSVEDCYHLQTNEIKNSFIANTYIYSRTNIYDSIIVNYNPSEVTNQIYNSTLIYLENRRSEISREGNMFHVILYPYSVDSLNTLYTLSILSYNIKHGETVDVINSSLNGNTIDFWAKAYGINPFVIVIVNLTNNNTAYYTIQLNYDNTSLEEKEVTLYFNFEKEDYGNFQASDRAVLSYTPSNGTIFCTDFVIGSNVEKFINRGEVCHVYRIEYNIEYSAGNSPKLCFTNFRYNNLMDDEFSSECIDIPAGTFLLTKGNYTPKNLILNYFNENMFAVYISTVNGNPVLYSGGSFPLSYVKLYMRCYKGNYGEFRKYHTVPLGVTEGNNYLLSAGIIEKVHMNEYGSFTNKEYFIPEDFKHVGENVTVIKEDGSNTVDGNYFIDITSWFKDGVEAYDVERNEYLKIGNPFPDMDKYFAKVTRNDAGTKYYHLYYTNKTYNAKVYCEDFASYCIMTKWPRKNYGCKSGPCYDAKYEYIDWSWKLGRRQYVRDGCGYINGNWGSEFITRYWASLPYGTYKIYVKHRARILDFDYTTTAVMDSNIYIDDSKIYDLSFRITCSGAHCTKDSGTILKETTWTGQVNDNVGLGGWAGDCTHGDAIHYYFVMLRTSGNIVSEVTKYKVSRIHLYAIDFAKESFISGYKDGYIDGNNTGYIAGWTAGNETGWNNGYTAGYDEGYSVAGGGIDWRVFFFPALAMFFALLNRSKSSVIRTLGKLMWFAMMLVSLGTFIYIDSSAVLIALLSSFGIFSFVYFFFVGYGEIINSLSVIKSWS